MIKIIDVDELFDKYIEDYVMQNVGKVKPEEIENKIPLLYAEFGDKKFEELAGATPNTFYRGYSSNELLECLKTHLEKGVAVSDFLCEALRDTSEKEMAKELEKELPEEYALYLMNILGEVGSSLAVNRYLDFVLLDYSDNLREVATEMLYPFSDLVKERMLNNFEDAKKEVKDCLIDVFSHASHDDRILKILLDEFKQNKKNISLNSAYLSKYGDERALPVLLEAIEDEKISYADFEELRFAIESLGGEYTKERDFSNDSNYKKLNNAKNIKIM